MFLVFLCNKARINRDVQKYTLPLCQFSKAENITLVRRHLTKTSDELSLKEFTFSI